MKKTKISWLLVLGALAAWYMLTNATPEGSRNAQQNPCSNPAINCR